MAPVRPRSGPSIFVGPSGFAGSPPLTGGSFAGTPA